MKFKFALLLLLSIFRTCSSSPIEATEGLSRDNEEDSVNGNGLRQERNVTSANTEADSVNPQSASDVIDQSETVSHSGYAVRRNCSYLEAVLGPLPPGWISYFSQTDDGQTLRLFADPAGTVQLTDPRIPPQLDRNVLSRLTLRIDRENVFGSAFREIMGKTLLDFRTHRFLSVKFLGELGQDLGGPSRELFTLLAEHIANADYGLFVETRSSRLMINPSSETADSDHIAIFKFIGRVLGMSLGYKFLLPKTLFIEPIYRILLDNSSLGLANPSLSDVSCVDPAIASNLAKLRQIRDSHLLGLTFTANLNDFNDTRTVNLCVNGSSIDVDDSNKESYIRAYSFWLVISRVQEQLYALREGFNDVVPADSIQDLTHTKLGIFI